MCIHARLRALAAPAGLEPAIPYGILINSQAFYQLNYRAIKIIFFFLHIYYNIFFKKNQKRFFYQTRQIFLIYGALPIELIPEMVGDGGLEPPTSGS